jgi:hypothetical protein
VVISMGYVEMICGVLVGREGQDIGRVWCMGSECSALSRQPYIPSGEMGFRARQPVFRVSVGHHRRSFN